MRIDRKALLKGAQLSLRASVAATLSLVLAELAGLQHPLYAMIAAVIVTDLSPAQTRMLGARRLAATVLGAVLGALLCSVLGPSPLAAGFSILAAMLACHLLHLDDAAKVAGYICGVVLLYYGADPWAYALDRSIETVLGIVVASAVSLVPKLIRREESDAR